MSSSPLHLEGASMCGWVNRDLRGAAFECEGCGLRMRMEGQLGAAIDLYLGEFPMRGSGGTGTSCLASWVGTPTGAELKGPDEPKLYYAYDRYADAYLPSVVE